MLPAAWYCGGITAKGQSIFAADCSLPPLPPRSQVAWYWWWQKMSRQRNDFFMWGAQEAIAVGGAGG